MTPAANPNEYQQDIVAVVNLHGEGPSAEPSIISAWRAVERANNDGLTASVLLVLDSPDDPTVKLAAKWSARSGVDVLTVHEGDLGASRNAASKHAGATWLAFLDGDDLWGEAWLVSAHAAARANNAGVLDVFHPQVNIIFGDHHSLLHHIDSAGTDFRWSRFCLHNAWTALSFVHRDLIVEMPYPRNELASGFGFEDWSWNVAVLDAGGRHHVVPGSCHFIKRIDGSSLLAESQQALRTRYPHAEPSPERNIDQGQSSPVEIDAGTHRVEPVELGAEIFRQIRLASTIEPAIEETLTAGGVPRSLPQNFNTHHTAAQFALEELWALRTGANTIGEVCDASPLLADLEVVDRVAVVAEFLLSEKSLGRRVGESPWITEATAALSQLASAP